MRYLLIASLALCSSCASSPDPTGEPRPSQATTDAPARTLEADTPMTTAAGNTFVAPAGWSVQSRGTATILAPPERGSLLALVDVVAKDGQEATANAWQVLGIEPPPIKLVTPDNDKDGWSQRSVITYERSPNEKRATLALVGLANGTWTVVVYDMQSAIAEKRAAQFALVMGQLLPKGYSRESFAGMTAHQLDEARIAELGRFVEAARDKLGVPGVSIGLVQRGEVVFSGGFGVREEGKPEAVDGDTRYIIASNTKALTTLMLAKLVAGDKLGWETPATTLLPSFGLGSAETTQRVQVKHLICACTGMPRQDLEWIFEFGGLTPDGVMKTLATMQPTSEFGALFQYSNPLAAAAGFIGGHVAYPELELGEAYDEAMRTLVFEPLGMKATTFDFDAAEEGNYAAAHSPNIAGETVVAGNAVNRAVIPVRPAGGAWSSVNDVIKYVQMELARGALPDGSRYLPEEILMARRAPQVPLGQDGSYGMGLMVTTRYGVEVVHHGGDLVGFHSDMMWLPEHGVGAVVLTNGDPGWLIRTRFRRKLLEVLFDGEPLAESEIAADAEAWSQQLAEMRSELTVPADPGIAKSLAPRYGNDALGELAFTTRDGVTTLDAGEWQSEIATKKNNDGSASLVAITPGILGIEIVVGEADPSGRRTLVIRDAQHEYRFVEK